MNYWIILNNAQHGPMTLEELASNPAVDLSTPLWHEGLPDWVTVGDVPETAAAVAAAMASRGDSRRHQAYAPQGYHYSQTAGGQGFGQTFNQQQGDMPPMPSTHLTAAILSTICCCLPLGIVAIFYAAKVSPAYMSGNYEAAVKASSRAEMWVILAFTLGIILAPFQFIVSALLNQG